MRRGSPLAALAVWHPGDFSALGETPKLYWLGGALGLVITITVMLGIRDLSPTVSISVILIAQLLTAAVIDALGWLGSEKLALTWPKFVGLGLMLGGVVVFKLK